MRVITTKAGQELLLPKNDFLFKLIFGDERNKDILKEFLKAVLELGEDDFDVQLKDTHLKPIFEGDKLSLLDIRIKTKTGKQIDVEMQVAESEYIYERITFYNSRMITDQISESQGYETIKKAINVLISDFEVVKTGDKKRYHHKYRMHDPADDTYFGDVEEIHVLELPKLPATPDGSQAWSWTRFIGAEKEEDLTMAIAENTAVRPAVNELYRASSDAEVRAVYEAREKAWRDEKARMDFALHKGQREIARNMKADGLPVAVISKYTGLNPVEIEKL